MVIPKLLKIGAHTIKIVQKDHWEGSDEESGRFDNESLEIWIKSSLAPTVKEATLIHEILHAINSELNHTVLDSFSEQLYQVLHDNKMLK